jgi:hypothetical protein
MPVLAGAAVLGLFAMRPKAWGLLLVGGSLSVLAAQLGGQARNVLDVTAGLEDGNWPVVDLTEGPFPSATSEFVAVRGYFRAQWTLDEYAVAEGVHPDQNVAPAAVVVPLTGTKEDKVTLDGAVVVVRMPPARASAGGLQTVRGKLVPVEMALVATILQMDSDVDVSKMHAVMVDMFAVPSRTEGVVRAALVVLCMLIAAGCFWAGVVRPPREAS